MAKIGKNAKAIGLAKWSVWLKIKIATNMPKTSLETR